MSNSSSPKPPSSTNTSFEVVTLVDLGSSPPSSPPSLARVKSASLLPRFTFNQESLVPKPSSRQPSVDIGKISSFFSSSLVISSESDQQPEEKNTSEDQDEANKEEELTSPVSPSLPQLRSPITTMGTPKRDRTNSTSSSGTSLSASATPFNFITKPRQLSIVRNGSPPSFLSDRKPSSSSPNSSVRLSPHTTTFNTSSTTSTSQKHYIQDLPAYPYNSLSTEANYSGAMMEDENNHLTSPRPSKAIRIISPLEHKSKKTKISSELEDLPQTTDKTANKEDSLEITQTQISPTMHKSDTTLRERRGKAEILSLYNKVTQRKYTSAASTTGGPSAEKENNEKTEIRTLSIFNNHPFSFTFPSFDNPDSSSIIDKAVQIPLPATPTTASSLKTMEKREDETFSPRKVPLPPTPRIANHAAVSPQTSPISQGHISTSLAGSINKAAQDNSTHLNDEQHAVSTVKVPFNGIDEIVYEIEEEFQQIFADKKDAEALFMGRLEEVISRIQFNAKSHICADPSTTDQALRSLETTTLEELYRSKLSNLQTQVISLKNELRHSTDSALSVREQVQTLEVSEKAKEEELSEAYKQFGHYKAEAEITKRKLQETITQLDQMELQKFQSDKKGHKIAKMYQKVMIEKEQWQEIAAEYKEQLESTQNPDKAASNSKTLPFVVVLLEGHPRMFDHNLVKRGAEGGLQMANQLTSAVQAWCKGNMPDTPVNMIAIQLFLDVFTTTKQLKVVGATRDIGHMHSFLDGFTSDSDLSLFCDSEGPDGPFNKLKEHIKLYSHISNCKMILIGTSEGQDYTRFLELLKDKGVEDKFYGIQSACDARDDPLGKLGPDRLIKVDGYFPIGKVDWNKRYQQMKLTTDVSDAPSIASSRSPSAMSRAPSAMSDTTARPGSPESDDDLASSHFPQSIPASRMTTASVLRNTIVSSDINLPPWERLKPKGRENQSRRPPPSDFVSVVDRRYNLSPLSAAKGGASSSFTSASGARKAVGKRIVIPIDPTGEGLSGDSPPESDEDEPSVQLPHSAVKHVQRPTTVRDVDSDDDIDTGLPIGFRQHGKTTPATTSLPSKPTIPAPPPWDRKSSFQPPAPRTSMDIIGRHISRAPSVSSVNSFKGANSNPLGSRRSTSLFQHTNNSMSGLDSLRKSSQDDMRDSREYMADKWVRITANA
ncbi:uncharacterized protein L201_003551 [Kwoniella dendrophila CBS 6074]|uniref:DUF7923 domain-containing protein n=1 Tax=Kwoniella dendrophila CBS 6074 TaxID=1295534 RepID=A0AAX4JUW2_9TREE